MLFIEKQEELENFYPNIYESQIALNQLCQKALSFDELEDDELEDDDIYNEDKYDDKDVKDYFDIYEKFYQGDEVIITDCIISSDSKEITTSNKSVFELKGRLKSIINIGMHITGKGIKPETFITELTENVITINQSPNSDFQENIKTTLNFDINKYSCINCNIKSGSKKLLLGDDLFTVFVGMQVFGKGIDNGTYIEKDEYDTGGNYALLNQIANSDASGVADTTITFTNLKSLNLY